MPFFKLGIPPRFQIMVGGTYILDHFRGLVGICRKGNTKIYIAKGLHKSGRIGQGIDRVCPIYNKCAHLAGFHIRYKAQYRTCTTLTNILWAVTSIALLPHISLIASTTAWAFTSCIPVTTTVLDLFFKVFIAKASKAAFACS